MCDLCELVSGNVITRKYYQNSMVIIVDCSTCGIPMLVFKHCGFASEQERRKAQGIIDVLFEYESIRKAGHRNLLHEHWHIEGAKLR